MPTYEQMTDSERRAELARLEKQHADKRAEIAAIDEALDAAHVLAVVAETNRAIYPATFCEGGAK